MSKRIVVIGSGAAGMSAASAARKASKDAEITVITEDEDIAYSPCAIPWGIEGRTGWDDIVMHDPEFYRQSRGIEVVTRSRVESVDGEKREVAAGGRTYPYDSLVVAAGGTVFVPPIEGKDLGNVFVVRTVRDGKNIQRALEGAENVVIGGAGVIGLELAVALRDMGKKVTVIEMMDQVIPRIADRDMADMVQRELESRGIEFVMKAPIQAVKGDGRVEAVTANGKDYPCEVMIFATGVRANLDIPKMLGLDIGQLNAVIASPTMNAYRRGRLVPDIFVAGDLVQCESAVMPGATMSQLGSTAVRQGIVAGTNAAGGKRVFGPVASPWVSMIGDLQIADLLLRLEGRAEIDRLQPDVPELQLLRQQVDHPRPVGRGVTVESNDEIPARHGIHACGKLRSQCRCGLERSADDGLYGLGRKLRAVDGPGIVVREGVVHETHDSNCI